MMPSWEDLEKRFRELVPALQFARLDYQTGTLGENWRLAGAPNSIARSQFEAIATMAGKKLLENLPPDPLQGETGYRSEPKYCWYHAISQDMRFYRAGHYANHIDDEGKTVGHSLSSFIDRPAEVSAVLCLELASMSTEEDKDRASVIFNVSGQNSRINVGSVDLSTNREKLSPSEGKSGKDWKPWGDHPLIVTLASLAAITAIISFILSMFPSSKTLEDVGERGTYHEPPSSLSQVKKQQDNSLTINNSDNWKIASPTTNYVDKRKYEDNRKINIHLDSPAKAEKMLGKENIPREIIQSPPFQQPNHEQFSRSIDAQEGNISYGDKIIEASRSRTSSTFASAQSQQLAPEGYVDKNAIWLSPNISVCWEPGADSFATERGWVKQSVRDHIQSLSSLQFLGWGKCKPDAMGIRVRVADERPRSAVGQQWVRFAGDPTRLMLDAFGRPQQQPTKTILNFSFQNQFVFCASQREHCIRAIAVHEFLHAVGFLHEQLRPDAAPDCKEKYAHNVDFDGYQPLKVGEYDPDSHLNYCANMYRQPIRLSPGDIQVLEYFYRQQ